MTASMAMAVATAACLACVVSLAQPRVAEAAFPGENGELLFGYLRGYDCDSSGIHAVTADEPAGREIARHSPNARCIQDIPSVSPDGSRVAFSRVHIYDPVESGCDIFVVGIEADQPPENLSDSPEVCEGKPAWSPDGSKLAFAVDGVLYTMDADGSERRRLTDASAPDASYPAWSPDGSEIAFAGGTGEQSKQDIYTMDADGTGLQRLTDNPATDSSPDWSPDGAEIAFDSARIAEDDADGYRSAIYVMDADGSDERKVSISTAPTFEDSVVTGDRDPAWSPDGTMLSFLRSATYDLSVDPVDGSGVYTANRDGSNLTRFNRARYNFAPDWRPLPSSPDGRAPETTIVFGPTGTVGTSRSFDFVGSKPGSSFECSMDGKTPEACTGAKRYSGLGHGPHLFAVRVTGGPVDDPTPATRRFSVDARGPEGRASISGGRRTTSDRVVGLSLGARDFSSPPVTGVAEMRLRNAGGEWGAWRPYAGTARWTLSAGEGRKVVLAQYRDRAGNVSPVAKDAIGYRR